MEQMKLFPSYFDGEKYIGYKVRVMLVKEGNGHYKPRQIKNSKDVFELMRALKNSDRERFFTILLDNKNNVVGIEEVSVGSSSEAMVCPREIFKAALLSNATAVILVHNHPSGEPSPSPQDKDITWRIKQGGELLGVKVLDHVIIGDGEYVSLSDQGLM